MPRYSIAARNGDPQRSCRVRMIQLLQMIESSQGPAKTADLLADGNGGDYKWGISPRQLARDLKALKDEGRIKAVADPENEARRCWVACRSEDVPKTVLSLLVAIAERWGVPLDLLPDMSKEESELVNSARERARLVAKVDPHLRSLARFHFLDNESVKHPVGQGLRAVSNALGSGKCVSVQLRAEPQRLVCLEPHAIVRARGQYWTLFTDPRQPDKPLVVPAYELAITGEVDSPVSTRFNAANFIANEFFSCIDAQANVQRRPAPAAAADEARTQAA